MALIKKCIAEGTRVYVLLRSASNRRDRIMKLMDESDLVQVIDGDLSDFKELCSRNTVNITIDAFYHFAWAGTFGDSRNNMELQAKNEEYALDAVRLACKMGAKVFIGAGSQAEYGRVEGMLTPNLPTNPENGYGIYKCRAGASTRELAKSLGMGHVWTRILSVYGPYDGKDTMIMATIAKLLRGEKPSLTKGEQIWDYLYSEDAAEAMYLIGESRVSKCRKDLSTTENLKTVNITRASKNAEDLSEKQNETLSPIYVIGSGIGRPLREYIEIMRDAIDPSLPLGFGEVPYGPKQVMHLEADISKLTEDTGFKPRTNFEDGIRKTIEYVRRETK